MSAVRRPQMSLRLQVTAIATAVVACALAATGVLVSHWLRSSLMDDADKQLSGQVRYVAELTRYGELSPVLTASGIDTGQVQVVTADRHVVAASPGLAATTRLDVFAPPPPGQQVAHTIRGAALGEPGDDFRIVARTVDTPIGELTVYAASSLHAVDRAVRTLQTSLWLGLPLLALLAALGFWVVVGRALSPVEQMRREVAAIKAPHERISAGARAAELDRLATTMNDLLARIDAAVAARRQFLADASHELRSPLASVRTQLEVGLAYPGAADWPVIATEVLVDLDRLQALAGELLDLARVEGGERSPVTEDVRLDALVAEEAGRYDDQRIQLRASPAVVRADRRLLVSLTRNLIDNAVRHAAEAVTVGIAAGGGWARLRVWNDGTPIAAADRERVFDAFTRLDEARSRDEGGAGLGLSIARRVCEVHGGTLVIEDSAEGVAFVARLPLSPSGTAVPPAAG
jgi:signal transduction histidine kinase